MAQGFPASNTIGPQIDIIEKDNSIILANTNPHSIGLVGFASKGPINIPTVITSRKNLHETFGNPHPDVGDPHLVYAAELALGSANSVTIVRTGVVDPSNDEVAVTATVDVAAAGSVVQIESNTAGSYIFSDDSFFRWRLNGVLASKILVVLAGTYTATELAATLNDGLSSVDGINFYVSNAGKIAVESTYSFGTGASIELVSVQSAIYGPSSVSGLGTLMTKAATTGSASKYPNSLYVSAGTYDFTGLTGINLQVVVNGTGSVLIDNVVQTIDLSSLETSNMLSDIVTEINDQITNSTIPGGFVAAAVSNSLKLTTLHAGRDASILVKTSSTTASFFGFSGTTVFGTSPSGVTGDMSTYQDGIVTGNATSEGTSVTFTADSAGIEGNNTEIILTNNNAAGTFNVQVYSNGFPVESFGNLNKIPGDLSYVETFLLGNSSYIRAVDNADVGALPKPGTYDLAGGSDGIPADPSDQDGLLVGDDVAMTGLQALSDRDQINIDLVAVPGHTSTTVATGIIDLCELRTDCMGIIDPPFGLSVTEIVQWQNGAHPLNTTRFDSNYAALFYPWLKYRDTTNKVDVWVPPSGAVLATIANSDNIGAPWLAPAGLIRGLVANISDVFTRPTQTERDSMYGYQNAVNPIIETNGGFGFAIWGQKTLQRLPSALDRINVRRMLIDVEKDIRLNSQVLLFEPNTDFTRSRFVAIADKKLSDVKTKQGLYDYIIQCDTELNTPDIIDRNELRARIGVQPAKAIEFIFIEVSIFRTGSFTENTDGF